MIKINAEIIAKFNPCKDRFDNFKDKYPGFDGDLVEFLSLDNITYHDKIWVCVRLMSRNQRFQFSLACAKSVLHIFEAERPTDTRVRDLIEFMETIPNIETMTDGTRIRLLKLRSAADAAADDAAAYVAADAAADAAYIADANDAAAAAVYAAAYVAANAAIGTQQDLNLLFVIEVMENVA